MQGLRLYPPKPTEENPYPVPIDCHPGDYWFDAATRTWMAYCPKGGIGALSDHIVVEHDDGTITVSPSILMPGKWHGYLERGVWREV